MADNESKRRRGAQPGNKNANKHGYYARESKEKLSYLEKVISECYYIIKKANGKNCKQYSEVFDG